MTSEGGWKRVTTVLVGLSLIVLVIIASLWQRIRGDHSWSIDRREEEAKR